MATAPTIECTDSTKRTATYVKRLCDGSYEYGRIAYSANRRRDRMVAEGTAPTHDDACHIIQQAAL